MAKKKTSTGLEVNYVRTDEKKLKKTISMADVRKDEGAVRTMEWKKEAKASLPASDSTRSVADRASYYLSARNTDNKMPTIGERIGYGAKSIFERTKATPDLLWETGKAAVSDFKANRENEAYQAAKDKREELERDYRNAEYLERLGVETPDKQMLEDAIAKILEEEERLKQTTQLDPDSYGMQTYAKGVEAEQKALAGLHPAVQEVGGWTLGVADYLSTAPLGLIPVVGKPAALGVMGAKAAAGKSYELSQEGASPTEAVTRGLVSGAIEVATEMTPLDEIVDLIKFGGKPIVAALLKQAGIEATEEGISYTLNYVADKAAKDPNATFSLSELRSAVLGGAFSGGLLGGGASLVNRVVNGNTAFMEDNDPRQSLPVVEARQDAPIVAKTDNTEKGVLSDSGGISEEGVKLDSEEEIVAQRPQVNSDDAVMEFARETVAKRQEEAERNIREATIDYGEQGVKAISEIAESTGRTVEEVHRDFDAAYKTGYSQIARERAAVANDIQERAYTAGYLDRTTKIEQNRAKQEIVRKEGGLLPDDYDLYSKLDTNTQSILDKFGKATGSVIVIDNEMPAMAEGYYDNGEIHIAPDIDKPMIEVARHEFTHRMQDIGTKEYASFQKYVQTYMQGKGIVYETADLYKRNNIQLSEQGVMDEVMSRFAEVILTDEKAMSDFVDKITTDPQTRTWRQKVIDVIRDLLGKLKSVLTKATDEEIATMERFGLTLQQVRKAEKLWMDAAKASVVESKNADGSQTTGIRYSVKSFANAAGIEAVRNTETGKVEFYLDGKIVTKVTANHIKNHSGLGALIKLAAERGHISNKDAQTQYKAAADIMNMILNTQDPDMVWAFTGSSMFSALKTNADNQYGTTIDFTTVCRKTQDMITAMSHAMMKLGRGLTKDEVTKLQADLLGEGSSVPCPVCFVFSRWAGIGSILDNMNKWQNRYDKYTPEQLRQRVNELTEKLGKGKTKDLKKMLRDMDEEYDSLTYEQEKNNLEKKQLGSCKKIAVKENDAQRLMEINKRLEEIAERNPQITKRLREIKDSVAPELSWLLNVRMASDYAQRGKVPTKVLFNLNDAASFAEDYPLAWKYRTSRGPSAGKAILPYSDMRLGDAILGVDSNSATGNTLFSDVDGEFSDAQMTAFEKAEQRTKAQNLIGGQRFQSTSDFRYDYALDYIQAFWEYQALGSKLQTYTKIIEFADMIAAIGGDVNLSVMPRNKGYVTLPNGKNQLIYSSVTGINYEAAKRANELHDNAQLILVGINDEHILAALEDSEETGGIYISFVIPYHASGASINEFIRVLVSNLGETFTIKYYQDYADVQSDKERKNATAEQKRRHELRSKLLKGKEGSKNWTPTVEDIEFIRGTSKDISNRTFEDLRAVELKALKGDRAAIAEYTSWTAGNLWNLYNRLWVNESDADYGVRLNTDQSKSIMPHEYWNKTVNREKAYINGFLFRSYCYNLGLTPRFSGAVVKGEKHGDFTGSTGYWKTLIDRPMYRNDGTYRDQQKINVSNFQQEMLTSEYTDKNWSGYAVQEPDTVRATRAAEKFIARESGKVRQYSLKDSEGNELSKEQQKFFADSKIRDKDGNLRTMWHGTHADFTVFDIGKAGRNWGGDSRLGKGFYFANTEQEALRWTEGSKTIKAYLNIKNPLNINEPPSADIIAAIDKYIQDKIDAFDEKKAWITKEKYIGNVNRTKEMYLRDVGMFIDQFKYDSDGKMTDGIREFLAGLGYDGIVSDNETVAFYPEQIKLTSNTNPTSDPDIRYSLKASNGYSLSEAQAEYFKDSKVRDENGNLLVMFHGTSNGTFTAFDTYGGKFGLFGMGSYFTDNPQVALSYTEKGKGKTPRIYSVFLNIKNPLDMDAPADVDKWRNAFKNADLDPSYLNDIETNEDAFKALKENLMDDYYERYEAEELVTEMILGMGYDGITHIGGGRFNKKDGTRHRVYIAFEPEQIKDTNNETPTTNADIRYSIRGSDDVRKAIIKARQAGRRKGLSQKQIDANVRNIVTNAYAGFNQEYGSIEMGEKPSRMVNVPLQTGEGEYVSRTIRTALEAGATPDAMIPTIEQMVTTGDFSYDRYTDEAAMEKAAESIKGKSTSQAYTDWMVDVAKNNVTKDNVAMGWTLYNAAANAGDTKMAVNILTKMVGYVRNAAQALQATRILKKLSPSAQLYGVQRSIENLQEELKKKYGDKAPNLEIDEELAKKFLEAKTEEERAEAMKELYKDIGRQIPASWLDKWNAWRYLAMLGNARTHMRNIDGNLGFTPVVALKNLTAMAIENMCYAVSGGKMQKNKGMPTPALLKAAWNDYANVAEAISAGGRYNESTIQNAAIQEGRVIFKTKLLEKARRTNSKLLEREDIWFSQPHYANALAQYCKAHHITAEQIAQGKDIDNARAYAMKEAMKATYRDINGFSDWISSWGKYKGDSRWGKAWNLVVEGVLPFRRTPANILARGVEYSPLGIIKAIADGAVNVRNGKMTAADVIDELSAGLTGTGLLVLGAILAAQGLVRGSGGEDEEKKKLKELQGHQEYALILGDKSYTIDFLAPEILPFLVGVNITETAIAKGEGVKLSDILSALQNITHPILQLSCLQSLNDILEGAGYAKNNGLNPLYALPVSAVTSYVTSGIPTLMGQAERTFEEERMTTYTTKDDFLTTDMQYTLGKISAKIPGVDYGQIPYIDAWGRTEATGLIEDRALSNFLKPYYESTITESRMEKELERLYDVTGDTGLFPERAKKEITVTCKTTDKYGKEKYTGVKKHLTAEEFVKYATAKGQISQDLLTKVTSSSEYKQLDDEAKKDYIHHAYELADAIAKRKVSAHTPDGWLGKAINAIESNSLKMTAHQYLTAYEKYRLATSEDNRLAIDGTTITNSASLQTMEVLYAAKLNDKQRKQLMEDFGVGKKVREYSPALVKEKLAEMRSKAD